MVGRVAAWRRFGAWAESRCPSLSPSHAWPRVRRWLAGLLRSGLRPVSVISLANHLIAGSSTLPPLLCPPPSFSSDLRQARDSLARLAHLFPPTQSPPLSPTAVARLLRLALSPPLRALVGLMWASAGRFADVARLWPEDLSPLRRRWWRLRWRITKTSQKGVCRLVLIRLPHLSHSALASLRGSAPPRAPMFASLPYSAVARFLRRHSPGTTTRSFRRGAVTSALDSGVAERDVIRLTGHRSVATLLGYADRVGTHASRAMMRVARALSPPRLSRTGASACPPSRGL